MSSLKLFTTDNCTHEVSPTCWGCLLRRHKSNLFFQNLISWFSISEGEGKSTCCHLNPAQPPCHSHFSFSFKFCKSLVCVTQQGRREKIRQQSTRRKKGQKWEGLFDCVGGLGGCSCGRGVGWAQLGGEGHRREHRRRHGAPWRWPTGHHACRHPVVSGNTSAD